jgi:GNAT superfamily N-acetyltransferase
MDKRDETPEILTDILYRPIELTDINGELFRRFSRRQVVNDCRRWVDGKWVVRKDPFIDDWTKEDYEWIIDKMHRIIDEGGFLYGAFEGEYLKGFVSVLSEPLGSRRQYLDLFFLFVSEEQRGKGVGKRLFAQARKWAREKGAESLYISAHSAIESQTFYRAMGCVDAEEISQPHVLHEPLDCQMECRVDDIL